MEKNLNNETDAYISKVEEIDGELSLLIPPQLMEKLNWGEGDVLVWAFENGRVTVKKVDSK